MNINIFKTKEEVSDKLSDYIIKHHLYSSIALSGGSTPLQLFNDLFKKLSEKKNLETKFFWVDERCVPPDSTDSNYKMAKENLFSSSIFREENIFRVRGELDPIVEVKSYSDLLRKELKIKNGLPYFDLIILGLGDDGHTASLFPHEFKSFKNQNDCVIASHPSSGQKRISLSEKIINNAKEVIFHVTGSNKKTVIDEIISKKDNFANYPATYIEPLSKNLSWYLDFDAADKLIND